MDPSILLEISKLGLGGAALIFLWKIATKALHDNKEIVNTMIEKHEEERRTFYERADKTTHKAIETQQNTNLVVSQLTEVVKEIKAKDEDA